MKQKFLVKNFKAAFIPVVFATCISCMVGSCEERAADEMPQGVATADMIGSAVSTTSTNGSPFHTSVGSPIPLETALRWKANFDKRNEWSVKSRYFGSEIFQRILSQPGVVGISIDLALDDDGVPQFLLVGVNGEGRALTKAGEVGFTDVSTACPPDCPTF